MIMHCADFARPCITVMLPSKSLSPEVLTQADFLLFPSGALQQGTKVKGTSPFTS